MNSSKPLYNPNIHTHSMSISQSICEARAIANINSKLDQYLHIVFKAINAIRLSRTTSRLRFILTNFSFHLLQGLLSANSLCWWNNALNGATKSLVYKGYVSPGALLVGSEPCALEVLRGAWARRVLQPPAGYQIVGLGK